jgi:hypothetical protein
MSRQNRAATEVVGSVAHEDEREERHQAQAKAATKRNIDPARLGGELSAEDRPHDETETADALKRSARGG